jgi:hypothetical protein
MSLQNRRATSHRSHLALILLEKLLAHPNTILVLPSESNPACVQSDDPDHQALDHPVVISLHQRRPGPDAPPWKIPVAERPNVVRRVVENRESLSKVAEDYGVSYETIRRLVRAAHKPNASDEANA